MKPKPVRSRLPIFGPRRDRVVSESARRLMLISSGLGGSGEAKSARSRRLISGGRPRRVEARPALSRLLISSLRCDRMVSGLARRMLLISRGLVGGEVKPGRSILLAYGARRGCVVAEAAPSRLLIPRVRRNRVESELARRALLISGGLGGGGKVESVLRGLLISGGRRGRMESKSARHGLESSRSGGGMARALPGRCREGAGANLPHVGREECHGSGSSSRMFIGAMPSGFRTSVIRVVAHNIHSRLFIGGCLHAAALTLLVGL